MTTPMSDPRPFADVLRDWMARGGMTYETAAAALGDDGRPVARRALANWLQGDPPRYERQARALMTLLDGGHLSNPVGCFDPLSSQAETT